MKSRALYRGVTYLYLLSLVSVLLAPRPVAAQVYVPGCMVTSTYDATVPIAWMQLSLQLTQRTMGYSPPVAARTFGYLGLTLYEAVVPGMPGYQSLAGQVNGLGGLPITPVGAMRHWPTVVNAALASILRDLFPTALADDLSAIDTLEAQFAAEFAEEVRPDVFADSVAHGQAVAQAIFVWSQTDGGHEGFRRNQPKEYNPPVGEGLWTPTPRRFGRALQPTWGQNRPFALTSGAMCGAPPPPQFSIAVGSPFYQAALEVYDTVKNITPEQKEIALFWADDPVTTATPPGHSLAIATQLLQQEDASLSLAALVYAQVGMALNDAFISAWQTKYTYNVLRPITYIQQQIDPTWNNPEVTDPLITPPFPSYPSGHATEAAAAMTVLTALFGEEYLFTDRTHVDRGFAPRSFDSLLQVAEETAISRLYGGIHYRFDNEAGLQQGTCVGEVVAQLRFVK